MNNIMAANMIAEKSSVIKRLYWDSERKDLTVYFRSGSVYIYTPVSKEFYQKIDNAESKGKYFNKNIKNNEALTCLKLIK